MSGVAGGAGRVGRSWWVARVVGSVVGVLVAVVGVGSAASASPAVSLAASPTRVSVSGGSHALASGGLGSLLASPPVAAVAGGFVDVGPGAPFYDDITWLAAQGITTGTAMGDGTFQFRPTEAVTRQAMAAFLYRAAGSPVFTAPVVSPFSDLTPSAPFYTEIAWLASKGISTGTDVGGGNKEFRPTEAVTREAMAAFLYRFAGSPVFTAPVVSPFSDLTPSAPFYAEISWLAAKGISTGTDVGGGNKEFRPAEPVSREAMAAFLHRAATPKIPGDTAYAWGHNANGELGDGTTTDRSTPGQVGTDTR